MLKEKIASNARQTLKICLEERSHISSTREEIVFEVSALTPYKRGKIKVAEVPKYDVLRAWHNVLGSTPMPTIFDQMGDRITPHEES